MSRILVVEDEAAIAELIAMNLKHAGHVVTVAFDAGSAQAAIDALRPGLVLLGAMPPGGCRGTELLEAWRPQEGHESFRSFR